MPPTPNTPQQSLSSLLDIDAVIVTHLHRDHFDEVAIQRLAKHISVFCQLADKNSLIQHVFTQVLSVDDRCYWQGIQIIRTGGQHGTGELAQKMGPVSGFVLQVEEEPSLYIVGDSVCCQEVEEALQQYRPEIAVVNAGAAQFLEGDPITMDVEDLLQMSLACPTLQVIAVHMEAWNHCLLTRAKLRKWVKEKGLSERI